VPEFTLIAKSPLGGLRQEFDGVTIAEVTDRAIVSVATPHDGEEALSKAVASAYQTEIPAVGQSTLSDVDNARLLGMQPDQFYLLFNDSNSPAVEEVAEQLGDSGYLTDQSDSWVTIRVSGPKCRTALRHICPIDLHPSTFSEGSVARTVMEHLGTIIVREGQDSFLLMSPRSSAASFLHAVQASVENVI
jgi:sarcosine oxidase subunit gamma